eukprot:Amastigsp_a174380_19.p6 type:complete len:137 gc:universal Amastigsp_a174380_19:404-814(+)
MSLHKMFDATRSAASVRSCLSLATFPQSRLACALRSPCLPSKSCSILSVGTLRWACPPRHLPTLSSSRSSSSPQCRSASMLCVERDEPRTRPKCSACAVAASTTAADFNYAVIPLEADPELNDVVVRALQGADAIG